MARLFESYIAVDWSAASKPAQGADSIWIGILSPDARFRMGFEAHNPDTRAKARALLDETLAKLTKRGDRVLVGFDFSLGYPRGTAKALGLSIDNQPPWQAMHAFLVREMKEKDDNSNNRYPLAARMNRLISDGPFPFWGVPKRDEVSTLGQKKAREHAASDIPEHRHTEVYATSVLKARPQPVWKLAYAGAVGGQTLTGIPTVAALRARHPDSRIWPFETGWQALDARNLDGVRAVFAEIYPSLVETTVGKGEVKDKAQVRAVCERLLERDTEDRLGACFAPPKGVDHSAHNDVVAEEGWILNP
jgi:hypothetical protein